MLTVLIVSAHMVGLRSGLMQDTFGLSTSDDCKMGCAESKLVTNNVRLEDDLHGLRCLLANGRGHSEEVETAVVADRSKVWAPHDNLLQGLGVGHEPDLPLWQSRKLQPLGYFVRPFN